MSPIIDLTKPSTIDVRILGGKAANLHRLTQMGLPVPPALVIPAIEPDSLSEQQRESLYASILDHSIVKQGSTFAVRSSGVGEDSEGHSFAGIFESYLYVQPGQLPTAINDVWRSVKNNRGQIYAEQRATSVKTMGVVIQHMIDADYAGVAFSVCPIEKDKRIALIEMVRGCGEQLVSNEKTPATVRVNKLTGLSRIARNGADNISTDTLESIADVLLPYIEEIEDAYKMPVDIEWAIAGDKVYILQARPITT